MATEDNTIQTMALGRPFGLGMLYDYRNDKLIPAMTLWDPDVLENKCYREKLPFSNYTVRIEKSLHDKAHLMNMGGSLKLSVLGGLIDVSGSAKYVNDRKETEHEERVTLNYSTTVHYKQLTMSHLATEKMIYTDILNQDVATHVVTGIVYGADAFFVFSRTLSKNEENTTVGGKLEVLLNKLPKIGISGGVELNMNDDDKQFAESLTCTFYGDFILEQNPSTFEEAVKLYKILPSLVGANGENAVAKTVYLYPLRLLNKPNIKMIRQISQNLIDNCVSLINDLYQLKIQTSDLINDVCSTFHQNKEHIKIFKNYINQFENHVKKEMMELLSKIRGSSADETQLHKFLSQVESSPFNRQKLSHWITLKEREITMESNFIQRCIADPRVDSSPNALNKAISDVQCAHIICLSIHLTNKNDSYLQDLRRCLDEGTFNRHEESRQSSWLDEEDALAEIREKVIIFFNLIQGNADNRKIKFVITDKYIDKQKNLEGIFLNFYENGRKKNVEIPSKPGQPFATEIKDDHILLTWEKPQNGSNHVRQYKIIYSKENDEESKSELKAAKDSESLSIQNLIPNMAYIFKVQVLTTIGLVIESDMSDPIMTKPQDRETASTMESSVNHKDVAASSVDDIQTKSKVSIQNTQKMAALLGRFGTTHQEVDEYTRRRTEQVSEGVAAAIGRIVADTSVQQQTLLATALVRSAAIEEEYKHKLQQYVEELDIVTAQKLSKIEKDLNFRPAAIEEEYKHKLQKYVEELDVVKAQDLSVLEKDLNLRLASILEDTRKCIDALYEEANRLRMGVLREAQAEANAQVKVITDQVAALNAEEASRLLAATATTVTTTEAKATGTSHVEGASGVVGTAVGTVHTTSSHSSRSCTIKH
ncbi:unnamed protein product [Adineta steineri]|uniref:Fibronectin type-III domain-containing protein n=1 Tax=Adineta steineri TaxID=433720 RepID=A0A814T5X0_9BILA|nr:unnamed protein product [Adineta steineri]CAF3997037.1 unnamed protein product [Adineta steineri]